MMITILGLLSLSALRAPFGEAYKIDYEIDILFS
jgi:hypothetical protein